MVYLFKQKTAGSRHVLDARFLGKIKWAFLRPAQDLVQQPSPQWATRGIMNLLTSSSFNFSFGGIEICGVLCRVQGNHYRI